MRRAVETADLEAFMTREAGKAEERKEAGEGRS